MICSDPYMHSNGMALGCGRCLVCRRRKRNEWVHRIILEAVQHEFNAFVTLTYDDEHLPADKSVSVRALQLWLKRYREKVSPSKVRYYAVGEYGERGMRPHYHVALFGARSCIFGQSQYSKIRKRCCYFCELVRETWGQGNVFLGTLEGASAGYLVGGYLTKESDRKVEIAKNGLIPEFRRMSLRPGIGGDATWDVASTLLEYDLEESLDDVPQTLRHGAAERPLGRYLTKRLREQIGRSGDAPASRISAQEEEMRSLRARASENGKSVKAQLVEENEGRIRSIEAKMRLQSSRHRKYGREL